MPSLNQVADFTASRLNRPFDEMLKAEIKFAFINEISLLIRRSIDANGIDKAYIASFTCDLIKVDSADDLGISVGYNILRSANKIPSPIRYKSPIPFIYVGNGDTRTPFGFVAEFEANYTKELPYIGNAITYTWRNGYIYIFNNIKLLHCRVIAPYSNFTLLKDNTSDSKGIYYTDDMELPYPEDLINAVILSLLQGLFGNLDVKDKVKATHLDNQ